MLLLLPLLLHADPAKSPAARLSGPTNSQTKEQSCSSDLAGFNRYHVSGQTLNKVVIIQWQARNNAHIPTTWCVCILRHTGTSYIDLVAAAVKQLTLLHMSTKTLNRVNVMQWQAGNNAHTKYLFVSRYLGTSYINLIAAAVSHLNSPC
jgi:hypothetical protein